MADRAISITQVQRTPGTTRKLSMANLAPVAVTVAPIAKCKNNFFCKLIPPNFKAFPEVINGFQAMVGVYPGSLSGTSKQ
jgi:hypothetical protein